MRSYLKVTFILCTLLFGAFISLYRSIETWAQSNRGEPFQTAAQQRDSFPTNVNLECSGCHGAGKTLPNLAGEKFHKDAHGYMDSSIHSKPGPDGKPVATCLDCHTINGDLTTVLPAENPKSTINRAVIASTCSRCHANKSVMQGTRISDRPIFSYQESVHAKAFASGNTKAATCTDCHTSHNVQPASDDRSTIAKTNIAATCGQCHSGEAAQFTESVHGYAVSRGVSRSPSCTDCHGIHDIQTPVDPARGGRSGSIAIEGCSKCHEGVQLTREFGVSQGRVDSYRDSYHGLASQLGSKVAADCASCHGVHNILPSSDPRSTINSGNLLQTCGQCHIGASDNFIRGKIHLTSVLAAENATTEHNGELGTKIVRLIYLPLIFLVIGGMVVHNFLVWRKKTAARRKEERSIVRLSLNQRIQHWFLLSSFIVLVLSGFALQYPNSWLSWLMFEDENLRRLIHRVAAVVMMVMGIYHLGYLILSAEGRQWFKDIWPRIKDVRDLFGNLAFYLGLSSQKPKIDRFGYAEKAEYWAVVWGTILMGLTGLMLWFKIDIFGFLPRWWIDIALAIHFYEAVLATLAIIAWHFYQVIFDPDVYPLNFAFIDGKVSEEAYKEEHELAFEKLTAETSERDPDSDDAENTPA